MPEILNKKNDGAGNTPAPPLSLLPRVTSALLPIYHALSGPYQIIFIMLTISAEQDFLRDH